MSRVGVVVFPGTNCELDVMHAVGVLGASAELLWHGADDLGGVDAVIVPGGFAHGDYLRTGAIARFSPVMDALGRFAAAGGPVLGICNGFQVLCESHLLPGALTRNAGLHFVCRDQVLEIGNAASAWTRDYEAGERIVVPLKNGEGRYQADEDTLDLLEAEGRVVAYYADVNPNGSQRDIAGICNEAGNVVGLMPHPEHAIEPLTGPSIDGLGFFTSVLSHLAATGSTVGASTALAPADQGALA